MLPNLSREEITRLETFVARLQHPLFQRPENKELLLTEYPQLVQAIPFESFWQGMALANVPHPRPENFEQMEVWDQLLWIRRWGLPVALKLISEMKAQLEAA